MPGSWMEEHEEEDPDDSFEEAVECLRRQVQSNPWFSSDEEEEAAELRRSSF